MSDPATRLRECYKQGVLARQHLDEDSQEWQYAQQVAACAESALVCLNGPAVLDEDLLADPEPPVPGEGGDRGAE